MLSNAYKRIAPSPLPAVIMDRLAKTKRVWMELVNEKP